MGLAEEKMKEDGWVGETGWRCGRGDEVVVGWLVGLVGWVDAIYIQLIWWKGTGSHGRGVG